MLIQLGDNVSTDEIMPAGEQVLPYRSNIAAISKFVFRGVDASHDERAMRHQQSGSHIVAGRNYGQGRAMSMPPLPRAISGLLPSLPRALIIIETSSSAYPYGMFTRKTAVGEEGDV